MEVAIAYMAVSIWQNLLFLFGGKLLGILDKSARFVNNLIVMARWQTDIVLERLLDKAKRGRLDTCGFFSSDNIINNLNQAKNIRIEETLT